jgi:hypothetical protein
VARSTEVKRAAKSGLGKIASSNPSRSFESFHAAANRDADDDCADPFISRLGIAAGMEMAKALSILLGLRPAAVFYLYQASYEGSIRFARSIT